MICTWGGVIIFVLSGKRYCHQIEMISVIKMGKGVELLLGVLVSKVGIKSLFR